MSDTSGPPKPNDADLARWRALWEQNARYPVERRRGPLGWLQAFVRTVLRPFVTAPQADLWERQRVFNLLIQQHLERRGEDQAALDAVREATAALGRDLQIVQGELARDLRNSDEQNDKAIKAATAQLLTYVDGHEQRLLRLEEIENQGFDEMRSHHEAVFSLIDHKLDQYRRRAEELRGQLTSLLEVAEAGGAPALGEAVAQQGYLELERRHRGTEDEISGRIEPYLSFFDKGGPVLDLGCGRGEAIELLAGRGIAARGVDSNAEMVARCREKGLDAEVGDLFEVLAATPAGTLGGVVSFHVIEHLPPEALERLVHASWRALAPGGVLALETPSPLSVVVGARNFWLDPTHQRPVHPDSLKLLFELAGFEAVERIDRQPFADTERLPEVPTAGLSGEMLWLANEVNGLRDQLDGLLYGFQDFGMVGRKPTPA